MAQKSVLIVGASGFVGKNVIEQVPSDWDVTATYCNTSDFVEFCEGKENVTPLKLDLLSDFDISGDFDVVVYIAANSDPKKSFEMPEEDFTLNAEGVVTLMDKVTCKKLVYFSSGAVKLDQDIPYIKSKQAGEANVIRLAKEKGFSFVILRLFEAFGPYSPSRKIFRRMCESLEKGDTTFTIHGDGTNLVDPMYVEDTARAVIAVVDGDKVDVTLDLCTGSPMTITEVGEAIGKIYNVDLLLKYEGEAVEKVTFSGDPSHLKEYYGFEKKITFAEGIESWKKRNLE
jgi:nucleoside-diphosphate-sugar epimerase